MTNAALHVARTGLDAQNSRMQVIANNLANVNTTGFKRDRANFESLDYQQITAPGAPSSDANKYATGLNLGTGVKIMATSRIDTQGSLQTTDRSLDLAISGQGFFQVTKPDGTAAYTRDGSFSTNADGTVVTSDGLPLQPQIQIPANATNVTIATDGTVSAALQGQSNTTTLGKIQTVRFQNASGLQAESGDLLIETAASGAPQVGDAGTDGRGTITQGSLEASNVDITQELVDMIETQRAYEVNSKVIKGTDEMLQTANQQL
ncbi:flagellar basal-body rod protein FlgG [Sphingomonas nostoxanthinifaciens]|uniref:flagellar basal-body rod protein FlgG n=1 Tax=Sphingomonas nostoxanthinifaciens TaxID=2872652 RepID=UPI001CC21A25|nr:flagellar basal-body rod protein FlgG [Sphingomonas nostoxanthinifaciens]UAK26060.1 flagellar basal-body rod protein FlgG [Sphingomonas nostoxanthinifaciens]